MPWSGSGFPAPTLGLFDRYFWRGGTWGGACAAALTASRGNKPSVRPFVPRRRLLVCPPCIRHMMKWTSSALWAVVHLCLPHRCPYRRCLQSRSRACRLSHRQWLLSGWWVGVEFRRLHPNPVGYSPARALLTKRETLVNSECRQRASAERYL